MKAEREINKCYDMNKITKRQRDTMLKHMEHHSFGHIRKMLDLMESGMTFTASHKETMKTVGK